jgi:hypothetical protein
MVFRRSCGLLTRSVGSTNRSADLLVGRTHLSGTVGSLVDGDPGVPMSHRYDLLGVLHFPALPHNLATSDGWVEEL